jgi:hypothetical protein
VGVDKKIEGNWQKEVAKKAHTFNLKKTTKHGFAPYP